MNPDCGYDWKNVNPRELEHEKYASPITQMSKQTKVPNKQ
jgi:hypothetical protein